MKTLLKVIIIITLLVIAAKVFDVAHLRMADFVSHGVIKTMNIDIDAVGLNKEECEAYAKKILAENLIEGMSEAEIAKEIYAHVMIHAMVNAMPESIQNTGIARRLNNSTANGIDLEDFGDTFVRQIAYNFIWIVG